MTDIEKFALIMKALDVVEALAKIQTDNTGIAPDKAKKDSDLSFAGVVPDRPVADDDEAHKKQAVSKPSEAASTTQAQPKDKAKGKAKDTGKKEKPAKGKAADVIREYRKQHPDAIQKQCIEDTGIPRSTVSLHWKACEPSNVPKQGKKRAKPVKSSETDKKKTKNDICKYLLNEGDFFAYIDECAKRDVAHSPIQVSKKDKSITLHGITAKNVYDKNKSKDDKAPFLTADDFTYNGLTANEVRERAEKEGRYISFFQGTPLSFGYPDINVDIMFFYPMYTENTLQIVRCYRKLHPDARQIDCMKDTGLTKNQVSKNWNK